MDDLAYTSATEIASAIRLKKLSPREVLAYFIDRIEKRNPSLNAFVFKGYEDARKAASAAEKAVMGGEPLGPLHGVPVAIKDLFDFKPGRQRLLAVSEPSGTSSRISRARSRTN